MQITVHPYTLLFKRPARTSRGDLETRRVWFLRASDPERSEQVGWGECGPLPQLSIDATDHFDEQVTQLCQIINQRPSVTLSFLQDMVTQPAELLDHVTGGQTLSPALAFGLEMALLDLGKGGQRQWFVTPFSRGEATLPTHGLIWMDTVDGVLEQIEQKVAQGFGVIKLKVGALPFAEECTLLAEVRRRHPRLVIRLDANGAFAPDEALTKLERLACYNIHFLEQPIRAGNWPSSAEICCHSPIPIALDEELIGLSESAERQAFLESIRPQHLILKPTLLGGFAACQQWIDLCQPMGIEWWVNSLLESNLGLNAICQWTSSLGDGRIHGLGAGQLFANNLSSPLHLAGAHLAYAPAGRWQLEL
jgi:o-succinylbenzoate synthase